MKNHGINQTSCVAIDVAHPATIVALTIACSLLGCCWVAATNAAMTSDAIHITHVIHNSARQYPSKPNYLKVDSSWSTLSDGSNTATDFDFEGAVSPNRTWMITESSGTTGTSKFIAISDVIAMKRLEYPFDVLAGEHLVAAGRSPPLSFLGHFNMLRTLARGGTFIYGGDLTFLAGAGSNVVIGSPAQFVDLCVGFAKVRGLRIRCAVITGGPSTVKLIERMFEYFEYIQNVYASTEAGVLCSKFLSRSDEDKTSVGLPFGSAKVQIVDGSKTELSSGSLGIIRVRTSSLVSGYIGDSKITEKAFQNGWFYPGDIGRLSTDGELHVTGRTNDQFSLGGVKVNATIVDEIIQTSCGVRDGICFPERVASGIDELAAIISLEHDVNAADVVASMQRTISEKLGPDRIIRRIYVSELVPRNATGKATRHLAVEAVKNIKPILGSSQTD